MGVRTIAQSCRGSMQPLAGTKTLSSRDLCSSSKIKSMIGARNGMVRMVAQAVGEAVNMLLEQAEHHRRPMMWHARVAEPIACPVAHARVRPRLRDAGVRPLATLQLVHELRDGLVEGRDGGREEGAGEHEAGDRHGGQGE